MFSVKVGVRMWVHHLVDDVDPVVELLPLQEGVQVVEQELEVVLPVSVGDDDGGPVSGLAVRRPVAPPPHHQRVLPRHLAQREAGREADVDRPSCNHKPMWLLDRRQIPRSGNESSPES